MNWLKIIIILAIIWIIGWIMIIVQKIYAKTKISVQMGSNPESAVKTAKENLDSGAITLDEYERQLIKIAENTGYAGAMLKLSELYNGESYKIKKNEEKSRFWKEQAVKAGDLKIIMDYYGFSDYTVSSDDYNGMIRDLNTAETKATSEHVKSIAVYLKGIVNFKMGNIDSAKQLFVSISSPKCVKESRYMLFQCFIRETNISAAEKILNEMEADKFKITANDYLSLYNYYATKRKNNEPNYESEIKYVQKYISSKDADKDTANRIGADTYYHAAKLLQNESKGFQTCKINAFEAFEKAAQFGHPEALYYVGMGFWTGKNKYMRDYNKANKYLLQAAQKGHKQAKNIFKQYGVDGILLSPIQVDTVIYQFMDGYEIKASGDTMKWLQLYYGLIYKAFVMKHEFMNKYIKKFKSFDDLINGIHLLYAEQLAKMIRWGVLVFMSFGIDIYDANDIMKGCRDLSLLPRVPIFENGLKQIDCRAEQLNMNMSYTQATRGCWSGAGFGTTIKSTITAAVKASVAAGAMNIVSGVLHGIGDSIVAAIDSSEIKSMGNKLFENKNTKKEFAEATFFACIDIGIFVRKTIEAHCNMRLETLEGNILFGNENLAEIDDRTLNAKINNNLSIGKNDYAYALLIEKLRRNPLDSNVYLQILELTEKRAESLTDDKAYRPIEQYGCDFGITTVWE